MKKTTASLVGFTCIIVAWQLGCTGQDVIMDASVTPPIPSTDGGGGDGGHYEDAGSRVDAGDNDAGLVQDGGSPWWADFPTTCPTEELRIPSEETRPPSLSDPLGVTPRLLWQHRVLCPLADDFSEDQLSDRDHVLAELDIDGENTSVVIVASQTLTDLSVPTIEALAFIDTFTGERLGCNTFTDHGIPPSTARTPLMFAPSTGHILGYVGAFEDSAAEGAPSEMGVIVGTLGDERPIRVSYTIPSGRSPSTDAAIGYSGIYFAPWQHDRIVGFDLFSDSVAFIKDPSVGRGIASITTMDNGVPIASLLPADPAAQWVRPFWLSQCADLGNSVVETPISYKPPGGLMAWDEFIVYQEDIDGQLVVTSAGEQLVIEPPLICTPVATTSFTETLCARLIYGGVLLTQVDIVTGLLEERTVLWDSADQFYSSVVAGRNGIVIIVADNIGSELPPAAPTRSRTFYFLDWQSGDMTTFSVLEPPSFLPSPVGTTRDPPTLSSGGILVSSVLGVTFAVQTDIEGLAVSPYPRGILGGNQNRGGIQALD